MSLKKILENKKNILYNNDRQGDYAKHCLDEYRICINLYSELEKIVNYMNILNNRILKTKYYFKVLTLLKKLNKHWKVWKKIEKEYNASITLSANVPSSTIFPHHLSNIFISAHSQIGEGCIIFQGVTIGSNTLSDSKNHGSPVIGNNVYIGSGATIIGKIEIGDNVRIGANTTVTKSVESNTTCVSQPNIYIKHTTGKENRQW